MSLDLRGYNTDEALVELDQFLDKALANGLDNFKLIIGKGILAKVVSDYLVNYFQRNGEGKWVINRLPGALVVSYD